MFLHLVPPGQLRRALIIEQVLGRDHVMRITKPYVLIEPSLWMKGSPGILRVIVQTDLPPVRIPGVAHFGTTPRTSFYSVFTHLVRFFS